MWCAGLSQGVPAGRRQRVDRELHLITSSTRTDLEVNFAGRGLFDSALGPVPIVDPIPAPGPVRSTND